MDTFNADIPATLGMDVINKESHTLCIVSNRLGKRAKVSQEGRNQKIVDECSILMRTLKINHRYVDKNIFTNMFFTRTRLSLLYKKFFHPVAHKLFDLLKRARPNEGTSETLKALKDLSSRYCPCQRIHHAPILFIVTVGAENIRFSMGIMVINLHLILQVVNEATKSSAACVFTDFSTDQVWKTFVESWSSIYMMLSNHILTYQRSHFGDIFIERARLADVEETCTGVEAHLSL